MYQYYFEKLKVWDETRELIKVVYTTCEDYPTRARYRIVDQIERAAISVSSNLTEGSARHTAKDQAHFTTMAYSSLMELLSLIILSNDLNYLKINEYQEIRKRINKVALMLNSLRKSQLKNNP